MDRAQKTGSRAGRPKAAEIAARADKLLAITESLLVKLGYEHTTLNRISSEAGVSKQTIYAKYGGKVGLLRAVLSRMSERSMSAHLADEDDLPLYEGLFARVKGLLTMFRSETAVAIATIAERETRKFPEFRKEMIESRERDLLVPLRKHIDNLKRRGLAKDVNSNEVAGMLLWVVSEEVVEAAATGHISTYAIEAKADSISRLFTDAIRAN